MRLLPHRQLKIAAALLGLAPFLAAQPGPVNLGFEEGQPGQIPKGWFVPTPSATSGYTATLTDQNPKTGRFCAVLSHTSQTPPSIFGNLMQSFDAIPYRGKTVRFRAAVRLQPATFGERAQLWLRVDRKNRQMGFFDNMGDRPITAPDWRHYDIVGDIDDDAVAINIGLMLFGAGKVWIDDASFEVLGKAAPVVAEAPRPLTGRGLENLVAFARLLGYVRHFHPSDEAAQADWEAFAIAGVRAIESAAPAELAQKLESLFRPVAPTLQVFPSGRRPPIPPALLPPKGASALKMIAWRHFGFGAGNPRSIYRSERVTKDAPDGRLPEPFQANLGGGLSCLAPLALFTDSKGTLPHSPALSKTAAPATTRRSANDRATRLAAVVLAWNVFQHFYPYFDVVRTDWPTALQAALRSAATDKDELAFLDTLARLVAALHDGHGNVFLTSRPRPLTALPLLWDWVEDRLIVTHAQSPEDQPIARGDAVLEIDGKPVARVLAETEALISGATSQWIRSEALQQLARGDRPATLLIEPFREPGERRQVSMKRDTQPGALQEPRPDKVQQLVPGIFYIDLERISDADFQSALPQLEQARGIVFDMRGYPKMDAMRLFPHLSEKPMTSAQWHVPILTRPDRRDLQWDRSGEWQIAPQPPYLKAKKAFLTDGRAISYAESCLGIVEHYKLGEIVGGPTAGTNGNVNSFSLPGGYAVSWTGMKVLKQDGSQHHGIGILPTIPVSRTRAGVAAGHDELLERAVQAVRN
jgi:hypothetical protein